MSSSTQTVTPSKKSTARNAFLIVGVLFLIGLVSVWVVNLQNLESTDLQGRPAPEFELLLFDQFTQEKVSLSDLKGQPVVINFWASWCVECYDEAPLLEQAWRDYQDKGVVFLGVDYLDTEKPALEYMERYGITYFSGPDMGSKISQTYAITGVPETFFIDREGNIIHVQIGPIQKAPLYRILDRLVDEGL